MTLADGGRDVQVAALGALVGVLGLSLAFWTPPPPAADDQSLALVSRAVGDVKRRPAALLGWQRLTRGRQVGDGDSVFVSPGAEAVLLFADGTELTLDERSLVVVERPHQGLRTLRLQQGALYGRAGAAGVSIQTPRGLAQLAGAAEARVAIGEKDVEIAVTKGTAQVAAKGSGSQTVGPGQRVAVDQRVVVLAPWPITLLAPDAQWYRTFKGAPSPVELTWSGEPPRGARVQIARDRLFAFVEQDSGAAGGRLALEHPSPGVTWWRLVNAAGEALSEARRFVLVEQVAPVSISPREGEVVLAPPGTEVLFAWAPLSGVTRYRLELSSSLGFEPLERSVEVTGADARLALSLPEGTWFYRVRAADTEAAGLPSAPTRFRLIHRGIPEAPELFNPEIEVTP
jgi:hypothetical protein